MITAKKPTDPRHSKKFITEVGEDTAEELTAFLERFANHWPNREPAALSASDAFHFKLAETKLFEKSLLLRTNSQSIEHGLGAIAHITFQTTDQTNEGVRMPGFTQTNPINKQ